jgi:hypothetical protein
MDHATPRAMGPIAQAINLTWESLPQQYADAIAFHKTVIKALPNINKTQHLLEVGTHDHPLRDTSRFAKELRKALQPIYHRKTTYGILTAEDTSYFDDGEHFSKVSITCIPEATIHDPMLFNDIRAEGGYCALDVVLHGELSPLVWQGYRGPGCLMVHEGDNLWEAMMVEIVSKANKPLDARRIGGRLRDIFSDGAEFERRFVEVVEIVKAIHARARNSRKSA